MPRPYLMFPESGVPPGARVNIYLPGENTPVVEGGAPRVFIRLYCVDTGQIKIYPVAGDSIDFSDAMEFPEGVLCSPVEIHTPQNAPVGWRFAVFSGSQQMLHEIIEDEARKYRLGKTLPIHPYEAVGGNEGLYIGCHFPFRPTGLLESTIPEILKCQESSDMELFSEVDALERTLGTLHGKSSYHERKLHVIREILTTKPRTPEQFVDYVHLLEGEHAWSLRRFPTPDDAQLVRLHGCEDREYKR